MARQSSCKAGGSLFQKILDYSLKSNPALVSGETAGEGLAEVFCDGDLVDSCMSLFENDLNVSLAAQNLYMHRNTLLYRIKKIKRLTNLDVTKFCDAVTFIILYRGFRIRKKSK